MPPFTGGIQTHVLELAKQFEARGHRVTMIEGRLGRGTMKRYFPRRLTNLTEFDVVHLHGFERLLLLSTVSARPKRLFVTLHGGACAPQVLPGVLNRVKAWSDTRAFLPLLRLCSGVIALHAGERERLIRTGICETNVSVVPNGVHFVDAASAANGEPVEKYLLFVGRVVREKRLDLALRLLSHCDNLILKIAGPAAASERARLEFLARTLGVEERVHFLGTVEGELKAHLQRRAAANVLMSDYEHQPLSVLEAAQYGTPSIVRNVGGVPYIARILGDAISIVDTPEDGAKSAQDFSAETRHERLLRVENLSGALGEFRWERIAEIILEIYGRG